MDEEAGAQALKQHRLITTMLANTEPYLNNVEKENRTAYLIIHTGCPSIGETTTKKKLRIEIR